MVNSDGNKSLHCWPKAGQIYRCIVCLRAPTAIFFAVVACIMAVVREGWWCDIALLVTFTFDPCAFLTSSVILTTCH